MEAPRFAFVTLCTSDAYLPGALVTLHSVLDVEPASPLEREWTTVALTTPATVAHSTVQALSKAFDVVIGVESIVTQSWEELKLLGASCAPAPSPSTLLPPLASCPRPQPSRPRGSSSRPLDRCPPSSARPTRWAAPSRPSKERAVQR